MLRVPKPAQHRNPSSLPRRLNLKPQNLSLQNRNLKAQALGRKLLELISLYAPKKTKHPNRHFMFPFPFPCESPFPKPEIPAYIHVFWRDSGLETFIICSLRMCPKPASHVQKFLGLLFCEKACAFYGCVTRFLTRSSAENKVFGGHGLSLSEAVRTCEEGPCKCNTQEGPYKF